MGTEQTKDPMKEMGWKNIGELVSNQPANGEVAREPLPKKIRQIPDCYFLPRRSLPSAIAYYGAWIAGGIGAGMLLEVQINKKIKGVVLTALFNIMQ